jgi:serine-aspartate repeat-containing protein C/D/E
VVDAEGNLIIAGNTWSSSTGRDVWVAKYDREGLLLWQKTYNGTANGNDYAVRVIVDGEGHVIVAATVENLGTAEDIVVLLYGPTGDLIWDAVWNGDDGLADAPTALTRAHDHIYVCGATWTTSHFTDQVVLKLNYDGVFQWYETLDHAGFIDVATNVVEDGNGDLLVSGASANAP